MTTLMDDKVWAGIPEELLVDIMKEVQQDHLLLITKVSVPGFRVGKIPNQLLLPKTLNAYKESELVKNRFNRFLLESTETLRQRLKNLALKKLREQVQDLVEEQGKNRVLLSLFLDARKGTKKLAEELLGLSDPSVTSQEEGERTKSQTEETKVTKDVTRLERNLVKKEKKQREETKKYNRIISAKDKKIAKLEEELRKNLKQSEGFKQIVSVMKEKELEQKIQITKLEDELSAMGGQLKKLTKGNEDITLLNQALQKEIKTLEAYLESFQQESSNRVEAANDNEDAEFLCQATSLQGNFTYLAGEGWLIGHNEMFSIPMTLVKEHILVNGDLIEVELPERNGQIFNLRVLEKVEVCEMNGYVLFDKQDYWVKAGLELIHVGKEEVQRVKAIEGDPVSIVVPLEASKKTGYITKIHRIYDIKELPEKKSRIAKAREIPQAKQNVVQTLKDKRILIVGGDSLKHRYVQELEALGAKVEWQSGFGEITAIPKKVSGNELVLLLTSRNSHTATNLARQAVQHYQKKVLYYHSTSIRGAVQAVLQFYRNEVEINEANLC